MNVLEKVAVIGAGNMGHGIAQVAAMAGYRVALYDIKQEFVDKGLERIFESMEKLLKKGRTTQEIVDAARNGGITGYTSMEEAVSDAQLIIEAVPEVPEIKANAHRQIETYAQRTAIVATNTSTMSITQLAENMKYKDRFVGLHYFMPAALMKLVEIIKGNETSDETIDFIREYAEKTQKKYIFARKDTPGFIANRIAAPVLVYNGLCLDDGMTPGDIDYTMKQFGQKMGPLELLDFTGVDSLGYALAYYHDNLDAEYTVSEYVQKILDRGDYGKKTGKGFYDWSDGAPSITEADYTGKYDPRIPFFIKANEACKLVESGVCSYKECDMAMEYGYNEQGPIAYIKQFDHNEVADILMSISEKYGKKIFAPSWAIITGAYNTSI